MKKNETRISEFILLGFTEVRRLQLLFFSILFVSYILTIMGNAVLIILANTDYRLHTPMYFFLWNFSILEIGFTTVVTPQTLSHLLMGNKTMPYVGCMIQFFLYLHLGTTEFFLLAVMSCDRYLAICNPLRYPSIMSKSLCTSLVLGCWVGGFLSIIGPCLLLLQFPMCDSNILDHFFCDITPLMNLLCGDIRILESFVFVTAVLSLLGTLTISVVSYINIIKRVLRIPSAAGRKKAFSTCASHFIVISITYGSCIFLYINPGQESKVEFAKIVAILNTIVSPLLNPFIYSLRNKQVREALKDLILRQLVAIAKGPGKS
ncbi:olfactory receptor 6C3-like [Candoia aspera]|uniref:olfactory receptor 6C3-like n=1 Tax=Candoia aspera TaxID=51853 RepID=UPI002FD82452